MMAVGDIYDLYSKDEKKLDGEVIKKIENLKSLGKTILVMMHCGLDIVDSKFYFIQQKGLSQSQLITLRSNNEEEIVELLRGEDGSSDDFLTTTKMKRINNQTEENAI